MTLPKITGSSSCFLILFPSTKSDDYGGVCGDSDVNGSGPQRMMKVKTVMTVRWCNFGISTIWCSYDGISVVTTRCCPVTIVLRKVQFGVLMLRFRL